MKQVVQSPGEGRLRVEDVPAPRLRPEGVLVRTTHSLISAGTERGRVQLARKSLIGKARAKPEQVKQVLDTVRSQGVGATYRRVRARLSGLDPLGYSSAGVVQAVGEEAREFSAGMRVACAGGGYANHAELAYIPRNLCVPLPPAVPGDAAAFGTLGAIAMQGFRQSGAVLGETVAVMGLGLLGLLSVQIARAAGCRVVGMDPDAARCALALELGAEQAVQSGGELESATRRLSRFGADAVLITASTSSNGPVALAGRVARDRARVIVVGAVGMDLPRGPYFEKELELRLSRSYGPGRYDASYEERGVDYPVGYVRWTEGRNLEAFVALIAQGGVRVDRLITHRFPLERAADAYELIVSGSEPSLGVILEYGDAADARPEPARFAVPRSAALPRGGGARLGWIGAGSFSQAILLPAFRAAGAELVGVATSSGLTARSVAENFGFRYAAADAAEILNDADVDAVVIATRHDAHAELVAAALRAGKPVFVEKPLALDEAGLATILTAAADARAAGLEPRVQVGFNRRYAPATLALLDALPQGAPRFIDCRVNAGPLPASHWLHDPKLGGGRWIGDGCHFVDLARWLAGGQEPLEATSSRVAASAHGDAVSARFRFADGSVAAVHYLPDGDPAAGKERVEVIGGGVLGVIEEFRRWQIHRDGRVKRGGGRFGAPDKGHAEQARRFVAALRGEIAWPMSLEDAVSSMRATFATAPGARPGAG